MAYDVIWKASALKRLKKLQSKRRQQMLQKVKALALNPYAPNANVKALKGTDCFRLRVADYRLIYRLEDGKMQLLVLELGPRGGIYNEL